MEMAGDIQPQPLPGWQLPASNSVVTVRAIDTTTDIYCNSINFVEPNIPGNEQMSLKTLAFLLEHKNSGSKILFDAGSRKDFWNLPPAIYQVLVQASVGLRIEKNVSEILEEKGVSLTDISSVVWR